MRQLAQRVDQVGHLRRSCLDLLIDFALVQLESFRFVQKFRVGHHRRQVMPQIVGNGARRAAQRRDSFRLNLLPLRVQQLSAHFRERTAQFGHFRGALRCDGVCVVSRRQRANSGNETVQRLGNGSRNETEQQRPKQNGRRAQNENCAVQPVHEAVHRTERHHHVTAHG